jgi:hypothetical protein
MAAVPGRPVNTRGVAILGSTGSIGTTALRVLARQRDRFHVAALTAFANAGLLAEQAAQFAPSYVGLVQNGTDAVHPAWGRGDACLIEAATHDGADIVLNAVVGAAVTAAAGTDWKRIFLAIPAGLSTYQGFDGRNFSGVGGLTAQAHDIVVDAFNRSRQRVLDEPLFAYGNVGADLCTRAAIETWMHNGRLCCEVTFVPKHASDVPVITTNGLLTGATSDQAYYWIWRKDSTHYVRINASTLKVEIRSGVETFTSTASMSWAQYDTIRFQWTIGAGTPVVKYQVNGGSVVDLTGSGTIGSLGITGVADFFGDSTQSAASLDYGVMFAHIQKLRIFLENASIDW